MAGAKRGAAEAVDGSRDLRPRVMPGTVGAAVTPRSAIAGGKRGTRAVRASERAKGRRRAAWRNGGWGKQSSEKRAASVVLCGSVGSDVCGDPGGVVRGALMS